ncbi:MAG TPA: hypothetical protein PLD84_00765 [Chitinophagales bacterium]|nr:hypothetical protein [Chitinophagales bacterium]
MKNTTFVRLLLAGIAILTLSVFTSCKNEYVVKPEDIQAFLEKGADLTITLPAGSSFDLVNVNGERLIPGGEKLESPKAPQPSGIDTAANKTGPNGEKKFRHAGAFIQEAFAGTGAYRCPDVCSIIIKNPQ